MSMRLSLFLVLSIAASGCIDAKFKPKPKPLLCSDVDRTATCSISEQGASGSKACCFGTELGFEKCSYASTGEPVCAELKGSAGVGDTCMVYHPDEEDQTDTCGPGLVCLIDTMGGSTAHCLQVCESDIDCNATACTERYGVNGGHNVPVRVCDPFQPIVCDVGGAACCNPIGVGSGCTPNSDQVCRLVVPQDRASVTVSATRCDVGYSGNFTENPCKTNQECGSGFVCVSQYCKRVCVPGSEKPGEFCGAVDCVPVGPSYGYCP